ncbi:MAG: FMN-binding protein [Clostridia bacterium]|nr:FMN-binding protein [Clostridia bacterium]
MKTRILSMLLAVLMLLGCVAVAETPAALVINQRVVFDGDVKVIEGADLVAVDGNVMLALAAGQVTVEAAGQTQTYQIAPYTRLCGAVVNDAFPGPVAVWVDFNAVTGEIAYVEIAGMGNPVVMEGYGADFAALQAQKDAYCNLKAADVIADAALTGVLADAVKDACARFVNAADFTIRPYQSMMVDRYVINNPHYTELTENKVLATTVVSAYPADAAIVETADVGNYVAGQATTAFGDFSVTHNAVKAQKAGIVLVSYAEGENEVLCALDIYDNFTLYPEVLSGSDSYGKVVTVPADLNAEKLTYRVLGDKAMNFVGGTCGSTVIDVTFDRATRTIVDVHIAAHSDSTYLSDNWEYGGGFVAVGEFLFDINAFCNKMIGMSADAPITGYTLSSSKTGVVGGVVVDGGVDMVVTGATRTPNAIISGVNAAIAQFNTDVAK